MAQREHEGHPLKLIIMSATIDPEKFKKFFHCECFSFPGRQFPVKVMYDSGSEDLLDDATTTLEDESLESFDLKKVIDYVLEINRNDKDGDILVLRMRSTVAQRISRKRP